VVALPGLSRLVVPADDLSCHRLIPDKSGFGGKSHLARRTGLKMSSGLRKVFGMGGTKELPMIRVSGVGLQVSVSDQGGGAFVSKIRCCSPAAFSGEIALGDNILTVDGLPASVKGNNASTAEWLTSSLDGEEGTPVWLLVANSAFAEPWQVLLSDDMQRNGSTNTSNQTARWPALTRSRSIYSGHAQFL